MQYAFNSIQSSNIDKSILEKDFENFDLSDETIFVSKKTYEHREEGLNFDYKYVVEVTDMRAFDGKDSPILVSLYLVPTFNCWNKKSLADFIYTFGYEEDEIYSLAENLLAKNLIFYTDTPSYGHTILMGSDSVKPANEEETMYDEPTMNLVHGCVNCIGMIDSLRGFYLDKPQNRIGTSGWDMIEGCIRDDFDPIQTSIDRILAKRAE